MICAYATILFSCGQGKPMSIAAILFPDTRVGICCVHYAQEGSRTKRNEEHPHERSGTADVFAIAAVVRSNLVSATNFALGWNSKW
jgi:hypothetical protein